MRIVVQKYGGSSVSSIEKLQAVARKVADTRAQGFGVCVVVSAMGGTTNELVSMARQVSPDPSMRELDVLLSSGEQISMSLLSMALMQIDVPAVSLTGRQCRIVTDGTHGNARIVEIDPGRIRRELEAGRVVVVAGFQGVSSETQEVTTLGRGGSDTSAVALAAALGAEHCDIFSDVDGVYSADPRMVADAVKLDEISFEEMLEMASSGAGVLMARSVEFGRRYNIPIHVRSSFHDGQGTWVKEDTMEEAIIRGVAHDTSEAKVTVHGVPDKPGVAAALFEPLAAAGANVDMIVQNVSIEGVTDISFTVPKAVLAAAADITGRVAVEVGAVGVDVDENIAKVSLIGAGMKSELGIAARMFRILSTHGINIEMISTSPIRISCVVRGDDVESAVQALHEAFRPAVEPQEESA
jgi:aspartate kinase